MAISKIRQILDAYAKLELAVLVGSRAEGHARPDSDWDIAIQWTRELTMLENLTNTETLRHELAVGVGEDDVDLIDLPRAKLAMRALVAEAGVQLKGEDSLAWNHFLGRTWREFAYTDVDGRATQEQLPRKPMNGKSSMQLDLYQIETVQIAREQSSLLDEASRRLSNGETLSRLEQNGVLHALQVLIENTIGKAKQILKAGDEPVPVSAYDALASLARMEVISPASLPAWNVAIGLQNRIVHEYMNIDIEHVLELVQANQHRFVTEFLLAPISEQAVENQR